MINDLFKFPGSTMRIVHEKTARFFLLYSAKCYAMDKYEKPYPQDPGKVLIKGLSFSKRDCCAFVSEMCTKALDIILKEGNLEKAKQFIKDCLKNLVEDKVDPLKLKIYKKLSKKVLHSKSKKEESELDPKLRQMLGQDDSKSNIVSTADKSLNKKNKEELTVAHALLAQRINERRPGLGPKSGESVQYLFIDLGLDSKDKKNINIFKKNHVRCGEGYIEEYDYVLENKLKIDKLWYLENQCFNNVKLLFGILMDDPKKLLQVIFTVV